MKIQTKPFGEVEVREADCLALPEGLIGFENYRRFVLLSSPGEQPFAWLQSLDDPKLAFVVVNPFEVMGARYRPALAEADLRELGLTKTEEVIFLCVVVVPEDPAKMTINLKGPIAFNEPAKRGKQVILANEEYGVRHLLLDEMKQAQPGGGAR